MKILKAYLHLVPVLMASACSTETPATMPSIPIDEITSRVDVLNAEISDYRLVSEEMPISGSANYSGLFSLHGSSINPTDEEERVNVVIGDLELNVTFSGSGNATGTIDNFYYVHGSVPLDGTATIPAVEGSLTITNGELERSYINYPELIANVEGEIDLPDDFITEVAGGTTGVSGQLYADFYENGITGDFEGSLSGDEEVSGFFIAVEE